MICDGIHLRSLHRQMLQSSRYDDWMFEPATHTYHIHSLDAHFTSRNVENRKNRRTGFVQ